MVTRRSVLALPCLLAFARSARAAQRFELWVARAAAAPRRGTIAARRPDGTPAPAVLVRRVKAVSFDMISQTNDNSRFQLWIVLPRLRDSDAIVLSVDGTHWLCDGLGYDSSNSHASMQLDRATAARIAAALGIPLHERSRLGDGLVAHWSFPPQVSPLDTAPIPVKLRVENTGTATVGLSIGGRQRGPRDNRFSFEVSRNGQPVPIKQAFDFGGIMTYKPLAPGESTELSVDLRSWIDVAQPGHYAIAAGYAAELVKDGKFPHTAADQANQWEIVLKGQGSILVR